MPPPTGYHPYSQPEQRKGGGGMGLVIAAVFVLLLLAGGGVVGIVGYQQGWFSKADGGPPSSGGGGGGGGGTTDSATAEQLFQEGYQLQSKNDNVGAIEKYRAAIAKQPQLAKAHRNLGAALVNTKQYREGIKELETALDQDPSPNDQVYYNLGLAHFKLKDYAQAGDYFKRAAETGKKDPEAHALAGFALDNANDETGAEVEYQMYLKADPNGQYVNLVKDILHGEAGAPDADSVDF
jgi:uncharacterized protein HemY